MNHYPTLATFLRKMLLSTFPVIQGRFFKKAKLLVLLFCFKLSLTTQSSQNKSKLGNTVSKTLPNFTPAPSPASSATALSLAPTAKSVFQALKYTENSAASEILPNLVPLPKICIRLPFPDVLIPQAFAKCGTSTGNLINLCYTQLKISSASRAALSNLVVTAWM